MSIDVDESNPLTELLLTRGREVGVYGVGSVPMSYYPPDPSTSRHDYYYNTRENVLYKRVWADTLPFWARISSMPAGYHPDPSLPY
jgi:hypothetical protein